MSKVTKYALIVGVGNVIGLLSLFAMIVNSRNAMEDGIIFLIGFAFIMLAELVLGLVLLSTNKQKEIGQGILMGLGISGLIGLSVCGLMINL